MAKKGVIFFLLAIVFLGVVFVPPYLVYIRKRQEYFELQNDIKQLKDKKEVLERELLQLKSDPGMIEEVARHKLGMSRPGEVIYVASHNGDE